MKGGIDSRNAGNFQTEKYRYIYVYQDVRDLYVCNKTKQVRKEQSPLNLF